MNIKRMEIELLKIIQCQEIQLDQGSLASISVADITTTRRNKIAPSINFNFNFQDLKIADTKFMITVWYSNILKAENLTLLGIVAYNVHKIGQS